MFTGKFNVYAKRVFAGCPEQIEYEFTAVTGGSYENDAYHKYTPSGNIKIQVTNPNVHEQLNLGDVFKVTFEKVEK